jgi:hypothetical protein
LFATSYPGYSSLLRACRGILWYTVLIAEGVACAYIYPSCSMLTAEPILKVIISNACGFGCTPPRLPRPLCGIAICAVYYPPGLPQDHHQSLKEYLSSTIDMWSTNCDIILLGGFNDLEISLLSARHNLKQVVKAPTRGSSILDLIITNLLKYYQTPQLLPFVSVRVAEIEQNQPTVVWITSLRKLISQRQRDNT